MSLSLLAGALAAGPIMAADDEEPRYQVSIKGPLVSLKASCDDPCLIEQVEIVGDVEMGMRREAVEADPRGQGSDTGGDCAGDCGSGGKKNTRMVMTGPRTLREGVEFSIEDNWAHLIFYSVTETEKGPATLKQHHEFRIDRPLIMLILDEHDVLVRTAMEQNPDVMMRRREPE